MKKLDKFDLELIKNELNKYSGRFKPIKYNNKLFNSLINKYNSFEYVKYFYDEELEEEEFDEIIKAHGYEEKINSIDQKRKLFNNWIDYYEVGNYGLTNNRIKSMMKTCFNEIKKYTYNLDRMYIKEEDNKCYIYFYGRDLEEQSDIMFIFWNDNINDPCIKCNKKQCWCDCKNKNTYLKQFYK